MPEGSSAHVICPHCGKHYRWKLDLAGRKVACKCGQHLRIPDDPADPAEAIGPAPGAAEDPSHDTSYALNIDMDDDAGRPSPAARPASRRPGTTEPPLELATGDAPSRASKCPSCNLSVKAGAVICLNCGYHLSEGRRLQTAVQEAVITEDEAPSGNAPAASAGDTKTGEGAGMYGLLGDLAIKREASRKAHAESIAQRQHFTDKRLPLIFLAAGGTLVLLISIAANKTLAAGIVQGLWIMLMEAVVLTPMLLITLFIAAPLLGLSFGYFGNATFKLVSISMGPAACADIIVTSVLGILLFFGPFLGLFAAFVVYLIFLGIPLSTMFDLDMSETIWVVGISIAVRLGAFLLFLSALFT